MDFDAEIKKQRARDEASYLENPKAFWLRPDKWDHDCPVWEIEGDWTPLQPPKPMWQPRIYHLLPGEEIRLRGYARFTRIQSVAWEGVISQNPRLTEKAVEAYDAARDLLGKGSGDAGYAMRGMMAAIVEEMVESRSRRSGRHEYVVEGTRKALHEAVDRLVKAIYPTEKVEYRPIGTRLEWPEGE